MKKLGRREKLLLAKDITKMISTQGATITDAVDICEMVKNIVKHTKVNSECVDVFNDWLD